MALCPPIRGNIENMVTMKVSIKVSKKVYIKERMNLIIKEMNEG